MLVRWPRLRQRSRWLFGRLDRAAASLNPILILVMIGLALIDLIAVCSLLEERYVAKAAGACLSETGSPSVAAERVRL